MAFLDVLRGIAATCVLVSHAGESFVPGYVHFDAHVFRLGAFGVGVFFLCSGFIIPASLERHNSLKAFWISRFFRLFPLYWAVIALALILHLLGSYPYQPGYSTHAATATLVNLTMLQGLLKQPLLIGLSWTLSFELGFYVLSSGLFLATINRRSIPLAGAMLAITLALAVHSHLNRGPLLLSGVGLLVAAACVWQVLRGLPSRQLIAAAASACIALALIFNPYYAPWYNALLFSMMFSGTVLYRWLHGEARGRHVAAFAAVAVLVAAVSCAMAGDLPSYVQTFIGAYVLFGAALALRNTRFPKALLRLGVISYSIYLVHPVLLGIIQPPRHKTTLGGLALVAAVLVISVLVSESTYRWIEKPMIATGHRFARRQEPSQPVAVPLDAASYQAGSEYAGARVEPDRAPPEQTPA